MLFGRERRDEFRSTYKLELWRRNGMASEKTFYFIVAPQEYSIDDKDRISSTKTFGGTWSENFGPDDKPITLSGDFGLDKSRDGWDKTRGVTGPFQALKYLRDNFIRLAELSIKEGAPPNTFYLKFYDLSEVESTEKGWVVKVNSFNVKRSKEATFNYRWSLQLLAYGKGLLKKDLKEFVIGGITPIGGDVGTALKAVGDFVGIGGADTSIGIWDTARGFFKYVQQFNGAVNAISSSVNSVIGSVRGLVTAVEDAAIEIIDSTANIVDKLYDIEYELEQLVIDIDDIHPGVFTDIANYTLERTNVIEKKWKSMVERLNNVNYFLPEADTAGQADMARNTQETNARMNIMLGKPTAMGGTDVIAGTDPNTGDKVFSRVQYENADNIPLGMTLSEIADKYYGSKAYVQWLVDANPNTDWANRSAEDITVFPRETSLSSVAAQGNLVFDQNPGGTDVAFDANGFIRISASGDVALTSGFDNIRQAVGRRLDTVLGALSPDDSYGLGLDNVLGEPTSGNLQSIIENRIIEQIQQDPRIQSVQAIAISPLQGTNAGDSHNVHLRIVTRNNSVLVADYKINRRDFNQIY